MITCWFFGHKYEFIISGAMECIKCSKTKSIKWEKIERKCDRCNKITSNSGLCNACLSLAESHREV